MDSKKNPSPKNQAEINDGITKVSDGEKKFQHAWNSQIMKQWEDWEIDQYLRGNHFIQYVYSASTNTLIATLPAQLSDNLKTKIPINKLLAAHKSLKGFITRGDRSMIVIPIDTKGSDEAQQSSIDLSSFAYFLYRKLKIKHIEKEMADFGLRRSFGVVKYYWDPREDNGKGFCKVVPVDTFDIYWDPNAPTFHEARYVIHVVKRDVEDVRNNTAYDPDARSQVVGDGLVSASYVRTQELELAYPDIANAPSDKLKTVLVKEMYYKDADDNVWVRTWVKGLSKPLREEKTEFKKYPFVVYNTDKHPNEVIGEAPLKPLVILNRVIDRIESQVADYNNVFAKGTYKMEKGAGLKVINNKTAKVFQVNQGFNFEQLEMLPLPATIFNQEDRINNYFNDISGIQEAMVGEKPEGTRSGTELEQLQEAAANNINDYRENMDIFLEELFMALFELYARHVSTPRSHPVGNHYNNQKIMQFVGGNSGARKKEGVTMVPDNIHVTMCPDNLLGYTASERFNRVMQLKQQGTFDDEAVLETLGVQGYQYIIARLELRRQQEQKDAMIQTAHEAMVEQQARSVPVAPKVNINVKAVADPDQTSEILETQGIQSIPGMPPDIEDAYKEHELLYRGVSLPGTKGATKEHTVQHIKEMYSPRFKSAGPQVDQAFHDHIMDEERQEMIAQMAAQQNLPPSPANPPAVPATMGNMMPPQMTRGR